jgi:hypothetical protein
MSAAERAADRVAEWAVRGYAALPQGVVDVLGRAHPLLALANDLRIPVSIARGRCATTQDRASVLTAGSATDIDYFLTRFFDGPIEREPRGRVSVAELPGLLRRRRDECDLTIARADRISARVFHGAEYLRLPDWAGTLLPMPADLERHFRSARARWDNVQRVRRNGLQWHVSRSPDDFDTFYETMYLPFARERHGALAVRRNIHQLRRVFRSGFLLWVTHQGRPISAILLTVRAGILKFIVLGTVSGNLDPIRVGGLSALYQFGLEYAAEQNLAAVDLGGVRPCLSDGVVWYKRKLGMRLQPKRDVYHDFLVYWPRGSAAVTSFLAAHPLVGRQGSDLFGLTALAVDSAPDDQALRRLHRRVWTPGLRRLFVLADDPTAASPTPEVACIPAATTGEAGSAAVFRAIAANLRGGA